MHSLNKGRRAEREIIALLQPILDHVWAEAGYDPPQLERRTLGLSGEDIQGLEWLSLEVKHRETLAIEQWWKQTVQQSRKRNGQDAVPALVYKKNHVPWRVRMYGTAGEGDKAHGCIVDISWEDFEWWFYYKATERCIEECSGMKRGR